MHTQRRSSAWPTHACEQCPKVSPQMLADSRRKPSSSGSWATWSRASRVCSRWSTAVGLWSSCFMVRSLLHACQILPFCLRPKSYAPLVWQWLEQCCRCAQATWALRATLTWWRIFRILSRQEPCALWSKRAWPTQPTGRTDWVIGRMPTNFSHISIHKILSRGEQGP